MHGLLALALAVISHYSLVEAKANQMKAGDTDPPLTGRRVKIFAGVLKAHLGATASEFWCDSDPFFAV